MTEDLSSLLAEVRACRACVEPGVERPLPHEPLPILRASTTARLAICSQAPGVRAHASATPFMDPSGVRLRAWMGVTEEEFYDEARVAIVPMGFCFPGADAKGGDLPPRPECAPRWRSRILAALPQLELLLLVGRYGQLWHLGEDAGTRAQDALENWRAILEQRRSPRLFPLPHPSWRNNAWLKRNPWFDTETLPRLRIEVHRIMG